VANIDGGIKIAFDVGYDNSRDPGVYNDAPAGFLGQCQPWRVNADPIIANATLTDSDSYREVDATTGSITITLPAYVAYMLGKSIWHILRIDGSGNTVTVQRGSGSDTVNGGASTTLTGQWKMLRVWCVAANTFRASVSG
jgi:hypothetical protein